MPHTTAPAPTPTGLTVQVVREGGLQHMAALGPGQAAAGLIWGQQLGQRGLH
jgi:hypothetical protein